MNIADVVVEAVIKVLANDIESLSDNDLIHPTVFLHLYNTTKSNRVFQILQKTL